MKQKLIIILVSCFLSATILVVTLYALSDKIVHEPGSFLRVYAKDAAIRSNDMDMGLNSWYIAGITDDHIYLGNFTQPLDMLVTNFSLTDSQRIRIVLKNMEHKPIYQQSRIHIVSPYFYYADGISPALFRGKIGDWQADRLKFDSAYFAKAEIIGPKSIAIRAHDLKLENVLGKIQEVAPILTLAPDLLQKQIDGVFCTDGMLRYNETLHQLIYTYYYRNE